MRRLALLVCLCGSMFGQNPGVMVRLLNGVSSAGASGVVNNNGQIGHQAALLFANAPGHTCSSPAGSGQLEYSFDNSTFYAFGSPQSGTTAANGQIYIGQGSFAYVRFNLISFDTTNCLATVWYSGSQQPLAIQLNGPIGSTATVVVCDKSFASTTTNTTAVTVIPPSSSGAIHICSIMIQASTSGQNGEVGYGNTGSAGAACIGSSNGGTGTDLIALGQLGQGTNNFGQGVLGQLFLVPVNNRVCFQSNTITNVTWNITAFYTIY